VRVHIDRELEGITRGVWCLFNQNSGTAIVQRFAYSQLMLWT